MRAKRVRRARAGTRSNAQAFDQLQRGLGSTSRGGNGAAGSGTGTGGRGVPSGNGGSGCGANGSAGGGGGACTGADEARTGTKKSPHIPNGVTLPSGKTRGGVNESCAKGGDG